MALADAFQAHLDTGVTTLARCWALTRRDGTVYGFTDHDRDIAFGGIAFKADTGLTARALQQTTGLSIDNSEALGALSDAAVSEADIRAGRFDGAAVEAWLVNWAAPEQRVMQFRGTLGEITRAGGAFQAELVGLSEALNRLQGRVYQTQCAAVLGDGACRADLGNPAFSGSGEVLALEDQRVMRLGGFAGFADGWFARGRLVVESGAAAGLVGVIRRDTLSGGLRGIELWESLRAEIAPGDAVRLEAGCDKTAATCKAKFGNLLNFRGFPDIPGEDRQVSLPVRRTGVASERGGK
ncbi:DUF2163 domain-containing protein [Sinisalibacter aestuarii]|uniref:Bacteriophage phiJL001 Gp84 C-terminal domain-containing protein n=1 Tax=Sinisalibacter aestuarii TaxID=2949426 RepID=A0ABQ5LWT3_9RHOB|nr:DUF2163 domain-containing protein [Sinisalibacter aestuarii]GKY88736.1 hypothetical protein STA1M1_26050 [Sinisalibacter aestuarii]